MKLDTSCFEFRFTALLWAVNESGERNLRISPARFHGSADEVIGVDAGGFQVGFTPKEVDRAEKTLKKMDSMPAFGHRLVQGMAACRDHMLEAREAKKKAMI